MIKKNFHSTIYLILLSCFLGAFWAIMPIFGWSEYSLEGAMISCSIEWNKRTPSVLSYNITITLFVFLIPLGLLLFTNISVLQTVNQFILFIMQGYIIFFCKVAIVKKKSFKIKFEHTRKKKICS